jgi:hypothetical protein
VTTSSKYIESIASLKSIANVVAYQGLKRSETASNNADDVPRYLIASNYKSNLIRIRKRRARIGRLLGSPVADGEGHSCTASQGNLQRRPTIAQDTEKLRADDTR